MKYRKLDASGLRISPICLGTMMFGGRNGGRAAARIIDHGRDDGVNFIDTADVYAGGRAEEATGGACRGNG